ncbi:MAG: universal stress protein [Proteobacteria bacterium]|nr:universal stress protein [Pseudomonadota bacterium]
MEPTQHILCPVDFSQASDESFRYAVDLASRLGAEVHVLHVYQLPAYAFPDGALLPGAAWTTRILEAAQKELNTFLMRFRDAPVKLHHHLVEGTPHVEINRLANVLEAQLIVMGTHGRTGLAHLVMGSVAERVVRSAERPVLTVRGGKAARPRSQ